MLWYHCLFNPFISHQNAYHTLILGIMTSDLIPVLIVWIKLLHCKVKLISKLINHSTLPFLTIIKVINIQNWEMCTHMKTNVYGPNLKHEVHMSADLIWNDPHTLALLFQ